MGITTDCLCANREALIDELQSSLEKLMLKSDVQEKCLSVSNTLDSSRLAEEFQTNGYQPAVGGLLNNKAALLCPHDDDACTGKTQVSSPQTPPLLPLVSAMKGSKGVPERTLKVSWAADVYDPIPKSQSHTIKKKKKEKKKKKKTRGDRERNNPHGKRKHGKRGQRGSSSREEGQHDPHHVTSRRASYSTLILCDELGNPHLHDLPLDLDLQVFNLDFTT